MVVSFIGGGNQSKPPTCRKILTKLYHIMLYGVQVTDKTLSQVTDKTLSQVTDKTLSQVTDKTLSHNVVWSTTRHKQV